MLRKLLCLILSVMMILTCFTACGEIKGSDAGLVFPIDKDPKFLDPQIISYSGSKNIILNCFEGLVALNENGEIVPASAESWEITNNGLTYTFKLRQDCLWRVSIYAGPLIGMSSKETNSLPVTAHDFAFGLKRALLPETKSPVAKALYCIENAEKVNLGKMSPKKLGIKVIDDYTLQINLEKTDPDFLFTLLEPGCMPCNETFFEATGGRYGLAVKYLIYNGPFYINNWADNTSVSIRKNTLYYDSENVLPRSVYYSINNEQDTRLDKLKEKTYSVSPLTKDQASQIADKKKYTVVPFDSSTLSMIFNCSDAVIGNKNIRRAIVSALDYSVLESEMGTVTAKGIIPQTMNLGTQSYRDIASDVAPYKNSDPMSLFRKGLKELEASKCEITILCTEKYDNTIRTLLQSWQSALSIACTIEVEAVSESDLASRIKDNKYQIALCDVSYSANTAFDVLECYTSTSADNIINFKDKTFDNMVSDIKHSATLTATAEKTIKAEKYLIDSAVMVPLYTQQIYMGLAKGVAGTYFSSNGDIAYFKYTVSE